MSSPASPSPAPPPKTEPPPLKLDPLAGVLSYLIPGLGQISQGRIAKGVVFFVALYALFFYGMALGQMKNVYLPDTLRDPNAKADKPNTLSKIILGFI